MSFTAKELQTEINDKYEGYGDFFMQAYYEDIDGMPSISQGEIEVVDNWGGEGDGASVHVVIKVADRFFRMDGYYSSWGDSAMDGELYEVAPKEVMKIEYESI